ncbi:MAG TPA: tRNA preQ1(34) S-adenosylmethionine ribosyltransferase-isomerase QueA [Eubacteriales bacterium]|nr:tRNA preQ1(34) S-adenosylmethionine ribosyltransferase-isomerase QueA [Eubacteriales bacterium]
MHTSDFYYDLPKELIAQTPIADRAASRLLVYHRGSGKIEDRVFADVGEYIGAKDVLVRNNTRVIPARLFGKRSDTGGTMEFLLLKRTGKKTWECLARPARRAKPGREYTVSDELNVRVLADTSAEGGKLVELIYDGVFEEVLDRAGQTPLPPYITEKLEDKTRYQTVYAEVSGSAAAPTAGLHFTKELLGEIRESGTDVVDVLLHVGLGTFRPVSEENIEDHVMHREYYEVSADAAERINRARRNGGRIIAVGTTSTRTLESVSAEDGTVLPGSDWTGIYITPGYRFKAVDALITNFHLPESTLLMLVSAFMGREEALRCYEHAISERYRFFSFGDAMLIL